MEGVIFMPKFENLVGNRYGRLVVMSKAGIQSKHTSWNCVCDCGEVTECLGINLKRGKSGSCGCLRKELSTQRSTKHGNRKGNSTSREYETWCSMIGRCETETNTNYHNYGARSIKVCDRWRKSFEHFLADMGKRPSDKHSIERDDVNGNYEPSNCRWVTKEVQMRNRRIFKNNSTGVNGVYPSPNSNRFFAQINYDGVRKHLGTFDTLVEATEARKKAEQQFWETS